MKQIFSQSYFNKSEFERFILVADIGGENSYFAICGVVNKKEFQIIVKYREKTCDIVELADLLNKVLEDAHDKLNITLSRAVIAGAGVVSRGGNKLKLTRHNNEICRDDLKKKMMLLKFILINNFEAEGFGLDFINEKKIHQISSKKDQGYAKASAILGAGHGLGTSIIYHDRSKHLRVPMPSEAGHASFPCESYFDTELMEYIKTTLNIDFVSSERVVSGQGVCLLYDFLKRKNFYGPSSLNLTHLSFDEKIEHIFENRQDLYCTRAVELFVLFYARVARNLALTCAPYSGLYLSGKVAIASKDKIKEVFELEFQNHPSHKNFLEKIPIFMIQDEDLTLLGACNVAVNFYNVMN